MLPSTGPSLTLIALEKLAPQAAQALRACVASAWRHGRAELPDLRSVAPDVVGRLAWRIAVEAHPWAPLVQLRDPGEEELELVAGSGAAWVYAARAPKGALPPGLRLLWPGDVPVDVGAVAAERIRGWDVFHRVASDPGLRRERAALLSHAERAEVVQVLGPPGSGRRELARWAHAVAGEGALSVVSARGSAPRPGWVVVEDLEQLDRHQLGPLLQRLDPGPPIAGWARRGVRPPHPAFGGIVGENEALCDVLASAARHAPGRQPILVLGETGSGKEPLARAIHEASGRRGPLVALDLASRSPGLVDDDLFGHVSGAFDHAREAREGAFRRADRGTLFLDELGNLGPDVQAKLLRVLETGEVQPLGSDRVHKVDVRVVAATHADLHGMVAAGRFRADLLHRLAAVTLRLPPLRDRLDDVEALALHFLRRVGREDEALPPAVRELLRSYGWPGNVRELRAAVEAAATEAGDQPLDVAHFHSLAPPAAPVLAVRRASADVPALTTRELQYLETVTVSVPPLADRGAASVRHALLDALRGRVVAPDALRLLESWPWRGEQVDRRVRALLDGDPAVITAARVREVLPEVGLSARHPDPIVVIAEPRVSADGQVLGLRSSHAESAVVIGRARDDADASGARDWLDDVAGPGVGYAPFPWLPELSRVQALITRAGNGLVVHRAPEAALDVEVEPLGQAARAVRPHVPVAVGPSCRLRLREADAVVLEVGVFVGAAALSEASRHLGGSHERAPETRRLDGRSRNVWTLNEAERRALTDAVVQFTAGQEPLARVLREMVIARSDSDLERLRDWLAEHPTAYCGRLYAHGSNQALAIDLQRRLAAAGLMDRAHTRLPAAILRVLPGLRLAGAPEKG